MFGHVVLAGCTPGPWLGQLPVNVDKFVHVLSGIAVLRHKTMQVFQIVDWLQENYKNYKNMALVAMLGELDHGYPIMIPADQRN